MQFPLAEPFSVGASSSPYPMLPAEAPAPAENAAATKVCCFIPGCAFKAPATSCKSRTSSLWLAAKAMTPFLPVDIPQFVPSVAATSPVRSPLQLPRKATFRCAPRRRCHAPLPVPAFSPVLRGRPGRTGSCFVFHQAIRTPPHRSGRSPCGMRGCPSWRGLPAAHRPNTAPPAPANTAAGRLRCPAPVQCGLPPERA